MIRDDLMIESELSLFDYCNNYLMDNIRFDHIPNTMLKGYMSNNTSQKIMSNICKCLIDKSALRFFLNKGLYDHDIKKIYEQYDV